MIRTIVKPTKSNLTIKLPENLIGKLVEVIAFEVDEPINKEAAIDTDRAKRIKAIQKGLNKYRVDLTDFKFDRDEANDYD